MTKYPKEIPFKFMGFSWIIKFLDIETENFAITDTDAKIVHIYHKNKTDQNIVESLVHELQHVILFDMSESIFQFEAEKVCDKEENAVRLTSPRLFHLIKDNPKLVDFIVDRVRSLK